MNDYVNNDYFVSNNTKQPTTETINNQDYGIEIKQKESIDAYKKSESYFRKIKINVEE